MKAKILQITLLLFFINSVAQNVPTQNRLVEDEKGKTITNSEEREFYISKVKKHREQEHAKMHTSQAAQTAVELCSNGGFELYENVSGNLKLKNFLHTIGDPPSPTECSSSTNTANSYIDICNPNNFEVMATTVPSNFIDPYIENINAFDQYALKINYANSYTYGSIVQGKRFKTNNENLP